MKLVFNELNTAKSVIGVSFDNGVTWIEYKVDQLKKNPEIYFTEEQCSDFTKIKIRGLFKSYNDIDALYNPATIVSVAKPDGDSGASSSAIVAYVTDTIDKLSTEEVSLKGGYISSIKESKGVVTANATSFDTVIDSSSTDDNVPTSKAVYNLMQSLGNIYTIKPSVSSFDNLPKTSNSNGDVRLCKDTNINYVWYDNTWNKFGGTDIVSALDYAGAQTEGISTEFITQVTQDDGIISATKASLPTASETSAGIVRLNASVTSDAVDTAATSSAVRTINENLLEEIETRRDNIAALKVTLDTELQKINDAIDEFKNSRSLEIKRILSGVSADLNNTVPSKGKTLSAFSQVDGSVRAYFTPISITQNQVEGLLDTFEEKTQEHKVYVQRAISDLDCNKTGSSDGYIKYIKETDGIIYPEKQSFDKELNLLSTDDNVPSSKAVFNLFQEEANTREASDVAERNAREDAINNAIQSLNAAKVGGDKQYIKYVEEANGKLIATANDFDQDLDDNASDTNIPSSKAVVSLVANASTYCQGLIGAEVTERKNAITSAINNLSVATVGASGQYVLALSESNGIVNPTVRSFDTSLSSSSDNNNAPTSKAVYDAISAETKARKAAIETLGNVYNVKESVDSALALPTSDNKIGDVRNCNDTGDNYVWVGDKWDMLGGSSVINGISYTGATASGTSTSFITQVTQNKGVVSATKASLPTANTSTAGIVKLSDTAKDDSTIAATAKGLKTVQDSINYVTLMVGADKISKLYKDCTLSNVGGVNKNIYTMSPNARLLLDTANTTTIVGGGSDYNNYCLTVIAVVDTTIKYKDFVSKSTVDLKMSAGSTQTFYSYEDYVITGLYGALWNE